MVTKKGGVIRIFFLKTIFFCAFVTLKYIDCGDYVLEKHFQHLLILPRQENASIQNVLLLPVKLT